MLSESRRGGYMMNVVRLQYGRGTGLALPVICEGGGKVTPGELEESCNG